MTRLFQQRLSKHLLAMVKYLKYVFNDFFVIALIFFAGGLGLEYSNFLKQLRPGRWWLSLLIGCFVLLSVQLGRLATLVQTPDYIFLMPRDRGMRSYLRRAYCYSLLNASLVQLVVWFLMLPLLKIQFRLGWIGLVGWLVIMLVLKANGLLASLSRSFKHASWFRLRGCNRLVIPVMMIGLGLWRAPLAAGLACVWLMALALAYHRADAPVDWHWLISSEHSRMHTIYQIFNMFVDVPNLSSTVKRRRYLQPLLNLIRLRPVNVYLYLYAHGLARDKEFSGLYLRLTVIGVVLLCFLNGSILPFVLSVVFIYLIAFQLIPFYFHFNSNAFIHIYPLGFSNQLTSFQRILRILLAATGILFIIAFGLAGHRWPLDLLDLLIVGAEILVLANVYVPKKIRQASSMKGGR